MPRRIGNTAQAPVRRPALVGLILGLAVLAACGVTPSGGGSSPGGSTTPGATTSGGTATPNGATGATGSAVTLTLDKPQYGQGDTISVTIHDGLGSPIYSENVHTDCTIVQLDRQVNSSWQGVGGCVNGQPHPSVAQITPGAAQVVQLAPGGTIGASGGSSTDTQWAPGTYRAALAYVTSATQPLSQATVIYSATFTVA